MAPALIASLKSPPRAIVAAPDDTPITHGGIAPPEATKIPILMASYISTLS